MTGLRITVFGQSKDVIDSEEQLEERLSRPTAADIDAMRALEGDVIVLGAGGKMGPSRFD
jgi:hypothetical protein